MRPSAAWRNAGGTLGYRDASPEVAVERYAAEGRKFSLIDAGITEAPACRLLAVNGPEDSIFSIKDSVIVATHVIGKRLLARGSRMRRDRLALDRAD